MIQDLQTILDFLDKESELHTSLSRAIEQLNEINVIRGKLTTVLQKIQDNTVGAWGADLENTTDAVILADHKESDDNTIKYNGWLEDLEVVAHCYDLEQLKRTHENIRNILIKYGCEEHGDVIVDEICAEFKIPNTNTYYKEEHHSLERIGKKDKRIKLLIEWLVEGGYSKESAKEQILNANIVHAGGGLTYITYSNGVKDTVVITDDNEVRQIGLVYM